MLPRFLATLLLALLGAVAAPADDSPPRIWTCAEIRALPREIAERHLPVIVRGVVTVAYPGKFREMIIQDATGPIYVDRTYSRDFALVPLDIPWPDLIPRGMEVEVHGITGAGHFAPLICPTDLRLLGPAPLPQAVPLSLAEVLDGRWDCQRVRLSGVVQSSENPFAFSESGRLTVAAHGGRIPISSLKPLPDPGRLVDAEVDVTGVVFTYFNHRGEAVGAHLEIESAEDLTIRRLGALDPFAAPETPLATLCSFSPAGMTFHRVRSTGVVTLSVPGHYLYLQNQGRGVRVETQSMQPLAPGDLVEAAGFVDVSEHFGKFHDTVVRKIGHAAKPAPIQVDRRRVLGTMPPGNVTDADDIDGILFRLHGRLEKVDAANPEGPRLILESEGYLVTATLVNRNAPDRLDRTAAERLAALRPGCQLQIDGILQVELASGWPAQGYPSPQSFSVLVHAPEDIVVTRPAAWWTPRRLWMLLGGSGAALLVTLGWNWLLRRRVEKRSAQLAQEIQGRREAAVKFEATLQERERLAADLHDSLEQMLTSLALQLEAGHALRAEAPARSAAHLHIAAQLLARSREEVRRSVWDLRNENLGGRTLPEALQDFVALLRGAAGPQIRILTEGAVRPTPSLIAGNLLLLAREALTNVLKHARASQVAIVVLYGATTVQIRITDDGLGFDPAARPGPQEGHFGLLGMQERMKRLGGRLTVTSAPGEGTCITAEAPLPASELAPASTSESSSRPSET